MPVENAKFKNFDVATLLDLTAQKQYMYVRTNSDKLVATSNDSFHARFSPPKGSQIVCSSSRNSDALQLRL